MQNVGEEYSLSEREAGALLVRGAGGKCGLRKPGREGFAELEASQGVPVDLGQAEAAVRVRHGARPVLHGEVVPQPDPLSVGPPVG